MLASGTKAGCDMGGTGLSTDFLDGDGHGAATADAARALEALMPRTLEAAARFMADPARLSSIPKSSQTGKVGQAWLARGRRLDETGLPAGTLLVLGGVADGVEARTGSSRMHLLGNGMVVTTMASSPVRPKDDFNISVERSDCCPLTLHVAYLLDDGSKAYSVEFPTGKIDRDGPRNDPGRVRSIRFSLYDIPDAVVAHLVGHALECRFRGMDPYEALVGLRELSGRMGFRQVEGEWQYVRPPALDGKANAAIPDGSDGPGFNR